jgi:hypothetical protein
MDPTDSKPSGWYPSSRTPGMERYWNGDFWTGKYRPAEELQGQFGIAPNEPYTAENADREGDAQSDVWSALDNSNPALQGEEPLFAPGVRTEYAASTVPPRGTQQPSYGYSQQVYSGQYTTQIQMNPNQGLGIAALVLAFFAPLVGAILGHVAYTKATRTQTSKSLPLAAIIVGWILFAFSLLFWLPFTIALFSGFTEGSNYADRRDYGVGTEYSAPQEGEIASYSISQSVKDQLEVNYPDYDTWFAFCEQNLLMEAGSTTNCEVVVYPFSETNESEEFTATVEYLSGDEFSPVIDVTLDKEPTPAESFPRN